MTFECSVSVYITGRPDGQRGPVADAELHFANGPLDKLRLVGFQIWAGRDGEGFNVTFPATPYNDPAGTKRYRWFLRPQDGLDKSMSEPLAALILTEFEEWRRDGGQS